MKPATIPETEGIYAINYSSDGTNRRDVSQNSRDANKTTTETSGTSTGSDHLQQQGCQQQDTPATTLAPVRERTKKSRKKPLK